jgi:hypothetical protein
MALGSWESYLVSIPCGDPFYKRFWMKMCIMLMHSQGEMMFRQHLGSDVDVSFKSFPISFVISPFF